jgi:hypothetical protein
MDKQLAEIINSLEAQRDEALALPHVGKYKPWMWVACFADDFTPFRMNTRADGFAEIQLAGRVIWARDESTAKSTAEALDKKLQHAARVIALPVNEWSQKRAARMMELIDQWSSLANQRSA